MTTKAGASAQEPAGAALRTIAHDIGNLAYRLTFLRHGLSGSVPDAARREEAAALLDDTIAGLTRAAESLRSLASRE